MKKGLWCSLAACVLVAGCAAMHPRVVHEAKQKTCDGAGPCTIEVSVDCDRFYGCDLYVDYDLVLVEGPGRRTDIVWRLGGDTRARFAMNGIVVPSSDFECGPRADGREFACSDKHPEFGIFKYRVNVTVPDSLFGPRGVPSLDPWIVNR
jgi:hypothetical protein